MYRGYLLLVMLGILTMSYQLLHDGGARALEDQYAQKVAEQTIANDVVRKENAKLRAEWESLQDRKEAVEERARRDLFMVRPDEVLFRLETPEEAALRDQQVAAMPDYSHSATKPGTVPTFRATKAHLYWAPNAKPSKAARGKNR